MVGKGLINYFFCNLFCALKFQVLGKGRQSWHETRQEIQILCLSTLTFTKYLSSSLHCIIFILLLIITCTRQCVL